MTPTYDGPYDVDRDQVIAACHDENDLNAAGLVASWIGPGADRWAATLDQAIASSQTVEDLISYGYTVDDR